MNLLPLAFDTLLGLALLWLAWRALTSPGLFRAVVLFISFGLLMALVWLRLDAPDVALAEAAIGAGLTGAMLLEALAMLEAEEKQSDKERPAAISKNEGARRLSEKSPPPSSQLSLTGGEGAKGRLSGQPPGWPLAPLLPPLLVTAAGLAYVLLSLPLPAPGLTESVSDKLADSGVGNAVTAVLINFRGYDTLLEMTVLFLALVAIWSLCSLPVTDEAAPGPVLNLLFRLLVPILILIAGYLLWVGADAPGGAFQAGSVLGAAGVLLLLVGWRLGSGFVGLPLRVVLVTGLAVFMLVGAVMLVSGRLFLEYPPPLAGSLILLIETAAALSIGFTLAALFLCNRPEKESR